MKLKKTASGTQVVLSYSEWEAIGKKAGWTKTAELNYNQMNFQDPGQLGDTLTTQPKNNFASITNNLNTALQNAQKGDFETAAYNVQYAVKLLEQTKTNIDLAAQWLDAKAKGQTAGAKTP